MKLIAAVWVCGLIVAGGVCTTSEAADHVLVYQVEPITESGDVSMNSVLKAVKLRLDAIEVSRATVKSLEKNRIEITVPDAQDDEIERVKRVLAFAGSLEFRILANKRDHAALIQKAADSFPKPVIVEGKLRARWVPIAESEQPMGIGKHGEVAIRNNAKKRPLVLVVKDSQNVTSADFVDVGRIIDKNGDTAISFTLSREGGQRFGKLTGVNQPLPDGFTRRLGIIIGGKLQSAPNLMSRIGRKGEIVGRFTDEEVESIIAVLRAGALPARLKGPLSVDAGGPDF